jgi:phosphoglycerol transferase MdoB-like AlkP superfamily enzyme
MADPSLYDAIRIPADVLIALDNRVYHFAVQPYHYLLRMMHIISAAAFFGGIVLFDLRLAGITAHARLKPFARDTLWWLYVSFGVVTITGILLFLYEPVHTGSRAYFAPKLVMIAAGMINTLIYRRFAFRFALKEPEVTPRSAKIAGAFSLACWAAVMVFSSMNAEGVPKVLLR